MVFDTVVNTFELKFENQGFIAAIEAKDKRKDASMPLRAAILFEMFPFCILYNVISNIAKLVFHLLFLLLFFLLLPPLLLLLLLLLCQFQPNLEVTCLGVALRLIIPKIIGEGLSSWFELVKPLVEFKYDVVLSRLNSMFELATQEEVLKSLLMLLPKLFPLCFLENRPCVAGAVERTSLLLLNY